MTIHYDRTTASGAEISYTKRLRYVQDNQLLDWADRQVAKLLDVLGTKAKCHLCDDVLTINLQTGASDWDYHSIDVNTNVVMLCCGCLDKIHEATVDGDTEEDMNE